MSFTDEQQKAIDYRENRSAAVSASAGSGKTAVLVEHIAKLITDEENQAFADEIAAVTFTEKAAAELKSRLETRMEQLLAEKPENEFYRDQAARLSFAQISTISSFCLSLIKDNIRLLPLNEGITVLDDAKADVLSKKAEKLMLKRFYTEFDAETQGEIFRRLGGENELVKAAKDMYRFFSNLPDPVKWKNEQTDIYGDPKLFERKYIDPYKECAAEPVNTAIEMIEEAVDEIKTYILPEAPFKKPKSGELSSEQLTANLAVKTVPYFENLKDILKRSLEAFQKNDLVSFSSEISRDQGKMPSVKKSEELAKFDKVKDKVKDVIKSFMKVNAVLKDCDKDRAECLKTLKKLYVLEELYEEEFSRLKRKENAVDFSDLEKYALQAVKGGAGKGKFRHIIVDEFQDSNDIQYEIFKKLSDNEKNLYFVGDEKQCIYAFRNANPQIFTRLCNNPDYNNIKLTKNFRSSENVINTVNLLFSAKDKPKSFSENPWEDMSCGIGITACDKNVSELVKISSEDSKNDSELMYVAGRIREMVNSGFTVHDGEAERPCCYGDFAVLSRNNSTVIRLRKLMEEIGIPAVSIGEKDFTNLLEVEQVLAVLAAVIRPSDDISAVKALMCPAYGFSAEDMARVRLGEGLDIENPKRGTLQSNLTQMDIKGGNDPLHKKIHRFLTDMKLLRKEAKSSSTYQLIRKIYSVTALDQIMSTGLRGKERLANLRLLARYGRDYPRPADFLTAMKTIKKNNIKLSRAQLKEQEEKSVKLMTIHASKGLQFPVVFLAETNASPNTRDKSSDYIYDAEWGAGVVVSDYEKLYKYQTLSHKLLEDKYLDGVFGDELRLLYVAMTRAQEKLIVTAYIRLGTEGGPKPAANSHYGFILRRLEECPDLMNVSELDGSECGIETAADSEEEAAEQTEKTNLYDLIREKAAFEYPYQRLTETPAKFSATALGVKADEGRDENTASRAFYLGLPVFIKKDKPLTPKERGDLYHKVMENIDFTAKDAEKELSRLLNEGIVAEKEREEIKTEEIQGFLDSSICDRANKAEEICREFPIFTTINAAETENPSPEDLSFIQGIADMYFAENGEIVLVDYKTNRNTTAQRLTEEYKGQLKIYKKALEEMTGMRVKECWLYSFSLGQCIRVDS